MFHFGCNTSQPIPNILADTFFSKNGQVKFWPDNENFGVRLKKIDYFSLTARSQQKRTVLVSIPTGVTQGPADPAVRGGADTRGAPAGRPPSVGFFQMYLFLHLMASEGRPRHPLYP